MTRLLLQQEVMAFLIAAPATPAIIAVRYVTTFILEQLRCQRRPMMKLAKAVALLGAAAMGTVLIYAFTVGDLNREGSELLSMPWGIVSLVDLYVGLILLSGWIVYREKSLLRSVIWVVLMMFLGFLAASLYTFIAPQTSGGDWPRFWMGRRWHG